MPFFQCFPGLSLPYAVTSSWATNHFFFCGFAIAQTAVFGRKVFAKGKLGHIYYELFFVHCKIVDSLHFSLVLFPVFCLALVHESGFLYAFSGNCSSVFMSTICLLLASFHLDPLQLTTVKPFRCFSGMFSHLTWCSSTDVVCLVLKSPLCDEICLDDCKLGL